MNNGPPKGRLGIIGCLLMEDDILRVLSHDQEVSEVILLENDVSKTMEEKIRRTMPDIDLVIIKLDDLEYLPPAEDYSIMIWMKDMALHEDPEKLKVDMKETLGQLHGSCQAVLLFYGLCGNAFKDLKPIAKGIEVPVTILKDPRGEIVDDCIAAVVGGRIPYKELVERDKGVYFMTPMWAFNWREMAVKCRVVPDGQNDDLMRLVFKTSGYKKVIQIETGTEDQERYGEVVDDFAEIFGLEKEYMEPDFSVVYGSYEEAKSILERSVEEA
jgi:hypothetical protein